MNEICPARLLADGALLLRPWNEPDNQVSAGVLERCGFVNEGRLRQHMVGHDGNRVDSLLYGLLPEDLGGRRSATKPVRSS